MSSKMFSDAGGQSTNPPSKTSMFSMMGTTNTQNVSKTTTNTTNPAQKKKINKYV